MRLLVVLALVNGMVPGLREAVEAVAHYAATGHLAHTDADHGDLGDQGAEHGCSPTEHRCACCPAQPVIAPYAEIALPVVAPAVEESPARVERLVTRALEPPFRPPIA